MRSLRTAQDSADTVRRCSCSQLSPATAALGRLLLSYLFLELTNFATVEDLVSHLRASDARYRAAAPAEDHFLSLDSTSLTIDLLEQHLLAAETSAVAVGAACGTPRMPFFDGCSPSPLAPSYASAAAIDVLSPEDVGAASPSAKRSSCKGKGGRGGGGGSSGGSGGSGGGGSGGSGGGSGGVGGGGGGSGGSGGSGSGGSGGGRTGAQRGGSGGGQQQRQQHRSETPSPQQLRDQTCGKAHTQHRCLFRLEDAWRAEFADEVERPHWAVLLRSGVAIFDLHYDAILSDMYGLSASAEGDCYRCVPLDPGIEAAALGAGESSLPGTAPAEALHTFTLDSGASRCLFRDSTTLTPLPAPVPVRLADPSGGPVVARSSTVLPCPAVLSGSLPGLHLSSFSTNLVSTAALQDAMATTTTPGGSSLYTLATEPPQVAVSAQVSASGQVAASCSCRLLSHQTLLWHHRLGHPSLPRLRGMHSGLLVSGLPRSLPPLPPSLAPPCLPYVERRQRVAPPSSPHGRGGYFLLVVDDYTRYTTVFPLRSKCQVCAVLIPWICAVCLQLRERFHQDLLVLRLHSDRGGEFSSDLLQEFFHGEGILQSFTLPDSPQQNGIAERRIGLLMEVARTSMIHVADPHFLWPFTVWYAAHQLNLWPCVSLPETSPTLRWMGEVGNASVFRVWGSRAFVRDTSADKLSAHAILCVFLCFVLDAPGWQFYHPTSHRVLPSQDVMFEESVPFYRLFLYLCAPPPPRPLFLAPGPPPLSAQLLRLGVLRLGGAELGCAESEGAGSGGAELGGEEPGGAEPEVVEPGGAESEGAESGGVEPRGAASSGGPAGASPRLSPQQLSGSDGDNGAGAGGTGGAAAAGPGGARTRATGVAGTGGVGGAGAGDPTERGAAGAGGSGTGGAGAREAGAGGTGAGGAGVGGAGVGGTGAGGAVAGGAGAVHLGGILRPLTPPLLCPSPDQSQSSLLSASPLRAPSPYTEQYGGLTVRREPAFRTVSPVRTARRVPCSRPPLVPGTHAMALPPSSVPLRVPLPAPPESSLPESAAVSALVDELLDFAAACRLDYATAFVAESESASPPSIGGECALGTDVLEDKQEDFECLAVVVHCFASMLLASEGDPDAPVISTLRSYEWTTLAALGFAPATADPLLLLRTDTSLPPFYVLVYVDDLVFATTDTEALTLVKSELQKRHTCTDLGELRSYLGLQINRDKARHTITLTKSHMVHQVLQRFGLQFSSPQPTPLSTGHSLSAPPSDESVEPSGTENWDAAKRVLRYLCSTLGMGLVLGGRGRVVLTGHADASWVDDSAT
ncbi:unnamed protein product [Closterium sp. NIES-54]